MKAAPAPPVHGRPANKGEPAAPRRLRMKDLCTQTGLPRQVLHFYIQQGLLPEGEKTGRNMAYYSERHVERVRLIRRLQEEQFLPLKAIRAILDAEAVAQESAFSPAQKLLIADVKRRLGASLNVAGARRSATPLSPLLARTGVPAADVTELVDAGLLAVRHGADGELQVAEADTWLIELWGELRASGLTGGGRFRPRDLLLYEEAVTALFRRQVELITERLGDLSAEAVAPMVERALPLISTLLVRLHENEVRSFLAAQ